MQAVAFADALRGPGGGSVATLKLNGNDVSDVGAVALAEAVAALAAPATPIRLASSPGHAGASHSGAEDGPVAFDLQLSENVRLTGAAAFAVATARFQNPNLLPVAFGGPWSTGVAVAGALADVVGASVGPPALFRDGADRNAFVLFVKAGCAASVALEAVMQQLVDEMPAMVGRMWTVSCSEQPEFCEQRQVHLQAVPVLDAWGTAGRTDRCVLLLGRGRPEPT
jgi:hypothetical protein